MFYFKGIKLPNISGITFWPVVLFQPKNPSEALVNHEKIHLRQQIELLVFPFYIWYLSEWLIRYLQSFDFDYAYRNISFEREAYKHDQNLQYLNNRKFWAFLKYLKGF